MIPLSRKGEWRNSSRKNADAGPKQKQEEMAGWHHQLNGHEFEQALGIRDGQGSLVCCSSWGHKESNMTERLNNNHNIAHCSDRERLKLREVRKFAHRHTGKVWQGQDAHPSTSDS